MRGNWFLIFIISFSLHAIDLSLKITDIEGVALKKVKQGVPFLITVTIFDTDQDIGEPRIEHLDKLATCERYPVTTNISIINGKQTVQKKYIYRGRVDQLGTYAIGPAYYEKSNQLIQSNALSFKVVKGDKTEKEEIIEDPFVHASLNKTDVYQGEQIILTIRLCFRRSVLRFTLEPFVMPLFTLRELQQPEQDEFEYDGHVWHSIVYRYALYPQQSGDLLVPSISALAEREKEDEGSSFFGRFRSFFGSEIEKFHIRSKPVSLHILPLPKTDKRVDTVGVVKEFSVTLDKEKIEQGKGVVLTMDLIGNGDFYQVFYDHLRLPEGIRSYDSKKTIVPHAQQVGFWHVKKEWVLQVLNPGKMRIPEQVISFFDTEQKIYRTLKAKPLTLSVIKSSYKPSEFKPVVENKPVQKEPFIWPVISFGWLVILSLLPLLMMIFSYIIFLYRPFIEKVNVYRNFNRAIFLAYKNKNAQLIYDAWTELFVERLNIPQREKALGIVVAPFIGNDLLRWQDYIKFLEQMAFEKKDDAFDKLFQDTKRWIETLKVQL
ncbi:TPA: hypothetical protein DIC20_03000 [Candidatus Dependentiae bacterium]|nr:MAG: hypothetical protein US03_C0014G0014 [candidate division TM6 bacterium GW2011_GWF2_36_131]KKQ02530.1 MAG: hypothetical protein US13_C0015G0014 [candidate division TM6 bacterium GW2011_GWE2_36_25]KKQ19276.1 MAG: hypothetical protein US32_C0012G0014 [candidate division TM6 bacterium GW2011_GWA2_36_9]HBR70115.1 hypothetical protein [Candidatus Dependentiae bacterium]HCU00643.1 hypothetical protein [Candidatus Dependentiae bacterium]